MKLDELLKKNKAILDQRAKEKALKEQESKRLEEQEAKKAAKKSSKKKKVEAEELEKPAEEQELSEPKRGKKPVERQYMVVEDIEEVNQ